MVIVWLTRFWSTFKNLKLFQYYDPNIQDTSEKIIFIKVVLKYHKKSSIFKKISPQFLLSILVSTDKRQPPKPEIFHGALILTKNIQINTLNNSFQSGTYKLI